MTTNATGEAPLHPFATEVDVPTFHRQGYVEVPGFLQGDELERLRSWVAEIEAWPPEGGEWLQHDEQGQWGVVRTRTENFSPFHTGLGTLLTAGALPTMAGQLLGEPAVLYKEKANYKHPGGAGFAPHQDAPAYPHISVSVSCLLAVDDATTDNGCLEFVSGAHGDMLPTDDAGCVRPDVAESLDWQSCPVSAGSLVWFHSHTPHRSAGNQSQHSRRALYLTYNAASAGNWRETYYADKQATLAAHDDANGPQRISLIGHFQGIAPRRNEG